MSKSAFVSAAIVGISLVVAESATAGPPKYEWSGFYIGGAVGGAWQHVDYDGGVVGSVSPSSVVGSLYGGYNFELPSHFVLGTEGHFDVTDISGTFGTLRTQTNVMGAIEARGGYVINNTVMPYVQAGVVFANQTLTFPTISESNVRTGWTAGLGIEVRMDAFAPDPRTTNWTARAEYRHNDFGTATNFGDLRTGLTGDVFMVGLATKIGSPGR
jgi:outer membrane immunogenic protein